MSKLISSQTIVFDHCFFGAKMQSTLPLRRIARRRLLSHPQLVSGNPMMSSRCRMGSWDACHFAKGFTFWFFWECIGLCWPLFGLWTCKHTFVNFKLECNGEMSWFYSSLWNSCLDDFIYASLIFHIIRFVLTWFATRFRNHWSCEFRPACFVRILTARTCGMLHHIIIASSLLAGPKHRSGVATGLVSERDMFQALKRN